MTVSQVRKASIGKKYLLLRHYRLGLIGINTKAMNYKNNRAKHGNRKTGYIGFIDCDLMGYITHKIGII